MVSTFRNRDDPKISSGYTQPYQQHNPSHSPCDSSTHHVYCCNLKPMCLKTATLVISKA